MDAPSPVRQPRLDLASIRDQSLRPKRCPSLVDELRYMVGHAAPISVLGRTARQRQKAAMEQPCITLVVARALNGVIGREGKLPWHLPADLKRFKKLTIGSVLVMGRKTFESLPGLLPGRRHIVLTRDPHWNSDGAEVAHSLDEALHRARDERISVIGGADIFDLFLPFANRI